MACLQTAYWQDYHPKGHISFASAHPPHKAYTQMPLINAHGESYIQTLWPDHCVEGTAGADIESGVADVLAKRGNVRVVRKVRVIYHIASLYF